MTELKEPKPIWYCKIGTFNPTVKLPHGADSPMRDAVQDAFLEIAGIGCQFIFSGWSAELTESELAVVENRLPNLSPSHDDDGLVEESRAFLNLTPHARNADRANTSIGFLRRILSALSAQPDVIGLLREAREAIANPTRHAWWGAGEPDCPKEIKSGNGELHTLRCKVCGIENDDQLPCNKDALLARIDAVIGEQV